MQRAEEAFADGPKRDDRERVNDIRGKRRAEREDDAAAEAPPLHDPAPVKPGSHLRLVQDDDEPLAPDYSEVGLHDFEDDDDD